MNFSNITKKQIAIIGASAVALGSILTSTITGSITYNKGKTTGYTQGVDAGIVQGRVGYVKGYTGGTVALEGYDGQGNDFNCSTGSWVFRGDQIDNLKAGVEYDYNTIKKPSRCTPPPTKKLPKLFAATLVTSPDTLTNSRSGTRAIYRSPKL